MILARFLRFLLPWLLLLCALIFIWKKWGTSLFKPEEKVTVSHNTILTQIEALGKLELVRYHFKDVVEYKKEIQWLPDSRSVLIVAGEATGCLDLRKLTPQDLVMTGDTLLTVYLPEPEICHFKVNHQQSKVLLLENTYFQDAELVDQAYKYAERNVLKSAQRSNILAQTDQNAEKILKPMLQAFSGRKVVLQRRQLPLQAPDMQRQ